MKTLLLSALIIAGFAFTAAAQETEITMEEFKRVLSHRLGSVNGSRLPHRFSVVQQSAKDNSTDLNYTSTSVTENAADGSRRVVMEFNFDGKKGRTEIISKGGKHVVRRCSDCQWQAYSESQPPPPAPQPPAGSSSPRTVRSEPDNMTVSISSVYHYLGTEIYRAKKVDVYRKTKREEKSWRSGRRETEHSTLRVLIPVDGGSYRMETVTKTTTGKAVKHTRFIFEKELDPSIAITMPEVN